MKVPPVSPQTPRLPGYIEGDAPSSMLSLWVAGIRELFQWAFEALDEL
jgi:hypothetical protein